MAKKDTKTPLDELRSVILAYFRQEVGGSIRRIALWAVFGVLGSIFICIGFIFVLVGSLRVLQNETGSTFEGSLSWVPYLLVILGAIVLGAISIKMAGKK